MLSDKFDYTIKVLDMVQGYPVKREVEQLLAVRLRLQELRPEYEEFNDDNPTDPQQRWDRDINQIIGFLFEDGSMYCKDKNHGGFYLARNQLAIAEELISMGLYWASPSHIKEAQVRLNGTPKRVNGDDAGVNG